MKTSDVMAELSARRIDCGMLALPVEGTNLTVEPVFDEPFHVIVPAAHALAKKKSVRESDLLGERGVVTERKGLSLGLEEEVERIDHRHVGDEIDRDLELRRLLGKHQARQMIALRILLPVDEVVLRLDLERVGKYRRAAVRGGTQAHDLRPERDRPVVGVGRPMMQRDVDAHDGL